MDIKSTLDSTMASIGFPPLGQSWTWWQIAIAVFVVMSAIPFVFFGFLLVLLYKWLVGRPKVVYFRPSGSGSHNDGYSGYNQPRQPAGPYNRSDSYNNHECVHCRAFISPHARICPYCKSTAC